MLGVAGCGPGVLVELAELACPSEEALYGGVHALPWERWLSPERTLAVSAVCKDSNLRHSKYVALKAKDAIVDRQRQRLGVRSSIDVRDADVRVFVRLDKDRATVFLDASGRPLHLRGWRQQVGEAPLKESLAAAIVRLSGWDGFSPLFDPFCGSGTIPIEAELHSRRVPAQRRSARFGFERWVSHTDAERALVERVKDELGRACSGPRARRAPAPITTRSWSSTPGRTRKRRRAERVSRSPTSPRPRSSRGPTSSAILPTGNGFRRMSGLWRRLGEWVRAVSEEHPVSLLVPDEGPSWTRRGAIASRSSRAHPLFNGRLRCRLVTWSHSS